MQQNSPQGEQVSVLLEKLYSTLDKYAEENLKKFPVTCKKGCAHCCHLLALCTFAEGLLIAERLLSKPDWKAMLPRLKESALHNDFRGINKANYFAKKHPCVFLGQDNSCTIYEVRPACCRFHYVISNPDRCSPEHPEGDTATIDMVRYEAEVWKFSAMVEDQLLRQDPGLPLTCPIPIMVLYCMELLTRDDKQTNELVKVACSFVPSPVSWMASHAASLMSEGSGIKGEMTDEALVRLMEPPK